jgi:hypothetical protein
MSESIEAPKKRTYTRKPKPVVEPLSSDSEQSTTSTVSDLSLTPPEQVPQKPKRNYKKKVTVIEPVEIPSPPESVGPLPTPEVRVGTRREDTELIDSEPETEPVKPVKEKKPRTEKQQLAFQKMREARLAKTEELKRLRDIEREQKKLEKEEIKLENLNDKILEKASSIKQKKARKTSAKEFDDLPKEPQYVQQIPEKKHREILFV